MHIDKNNLLGNLMAQRWQDAVKAEPELTELIKKHIDKGNLESIAYYVGAREALMAMGRIFPELARENDTKAMIYALFLCYTEYQIRNT